MLIIKKKKNFQNLPTRVKFCIKCVISNQRPSSTVELKNYSKSKKEVISFNKEEICSACQNHELTEKINWKKRESLLLKTLARYRKSNGQYDVIVPGSGGKDSAYVSYLLKHKYGMNPLTVTWSPHLYTEIGKKNFYNWINKGGFDNILFTPNGALQRYLTRLAFVNLLHPFQPFIIGQRMIGPKIALKFGIKLIMYGETGAQYGNSISENKIPTMNNKYFTANNISDIFLGGLKISSILKNTKFKLSDFNPYIPILRKKDRNNFEVHHMSFYKKWDPQENFYFASKYCNFKPNSERTEGTYSKYSSIDDKIDNFHYYTTYIKFGLGRASYDSSQEVRNNKISREEAINLVKLYDSEFPKKYFDDFLNYIYLDKEDFLKIIDSFRPEHLWKRVNKNYLLRHAVFY
jgi:N-acetyl sugar amidotransferase